MGITPQLLLGGENTFFVVEGGEGVMANNIGFLSLKRQHIVIERVGPWDVQTKSSIRFTFKF
jgi:hypothetical protein